MSLQDRIKGLKTSELVRNEIAIIRTNQQTYYVIFAACGSVHLQIFNKTSNQMYNQSYIYCFVA
jgi:hypothetical protein